MRSPTGILKNRVRSAVSQDRKRFLDEHGHNLDLTYITNNLIAMAYPASGLEAAYRNDIDEVARMLNHYHHENFMVWNLSGRKYDYSKFDNRVNEYYFPDHHSPPMDLLFHIIISIDNWITLSPINVAVIHCIGGKGRTGTVMACYLCYKGIYESAQEALRHFGVMRSVKEKGVTQISQKRYVRYFDEILRFKVRPYPKPIQIVRIALSFAPQLTETGSRPVIQVFDTRSYPKRLLYTSQISSSNEKYSERDGLIIWDTDFEVRGDVLIKFFHLRKKYRNMAVADLNQKNQNRADLVRDVEEKHKEKEFKLMFRIAFHTSFVSASDGGIILRTEDLDLSNKSNKKFLRSIESRDFFISIIMDEIQKDEENTDQEQTEIVKIYQQVLLERKGVARKEPQLNINEKWFDFEQKIALWDHDVIKNFVRNESAVRSQFLGNYRNSSNIILKNNVSTVVERTDQKSYIRPQSVAVALKFFSEYPLTGTREQRTISIADPQFHRMHDFKATTESWRILAGIVPSTKELNGVRSYECLTTMTTKSLQDQEWVQQQKLLRISHKYNFNQKIQPIKSVDGVPLEERSLQNILYVSLKYSTENSTHLPTFSLRNLKKENNTNEENEDENDDKDTSESGDVSSLMRYQTKIVTKGNTGKARISCFQHIANNKGKSTGTLWVGSTNGIINIMNIQKQRLIKKIEVNNSDNTSSQMGKFVFYKINDLELVTENDRNFIWCCGEDNEITVWNEVNYECIKRINVNNSINCLIFWGKFHWMISGDIKGTMKIFDVQNPEDPEMIGEIKLTETVAVTCLLIIQNKYLVIGMESGNVVLVEGSKLENLVENYKQNGKQTTEVIEEVTSKNIHCCAVKTMIYVEHTKKIWTLGGDDCIVIWEIVVGDYDRKILKEKEIIESDGKLLSCVEIKELGQIWSCGGRNSSINVWNSNNGKYIGKIKAMHSDVVNKILVANDLVWTISMDVETPVNVWKLDSDVLNKKKVRMSLLQDHRRENIYEENRSETGNRTEENFGAFANEFSKLTLTPEKDVRKIQHKPSECVKLIRSQDFGTKPKSADASMLLGAPSGFKKVSGFETDEKLQRMSGMMNLKKPEDLAMHPERILVQEDKDKPQPKVWLNKSDGIRRDRGDTSGWMEHRKNFLNRHRNTTTNSVAIGTLRKIETGEEARTEIEQ